MVKGDLNNLKKTISERKGVVTMMGKVQHKLAFSKDLSPYCSVVLINKVSKLEL